MKFDSDGREVCRFYSRIQSTRVKNYIVKLMRFRVEGSCLVGKVRFSYSLVLLKILEIQVLISHRLEPSIKVY